MIFVLERWWWWWLTVVATAVTIVTGWCTQCLLNVSKLYIEYMWNRILRKSFHAVKYYQITKQTNLHHSHEHPNRSACPPRPSRLLFRIWHYWRRPLRFDGSMPPPWELPRWRWRVMTIWRIGGTLLSCYRRWYVALLCFGSLYWNWTAVICLVCDA